MAIKGENDLPASNIPDVHQSIITGRSDVLAIGRPGNGVHPVGMAAQNMQDLAAACIPQAYRFIIAGRDQLGSIRRPRHRRYTAGVAATNVQSIFLWLGQVDLFRPRSWRGYTCTLLAACGWCKAASRGRRVASGRPNSPGARGQSGWERVGLR